MSAVASAPLCAEGAVDPLTHPAPHSSALPGLPVLLAAMDAQGPLAPVQERCIGLLRNICASFSLQVGAVTCVSVCCSCHGRVVTPSRFACARVCVRVHLLWPLNRMRVSID